MTHQDKFVYLMELYWKEISLEKVWEKITNNLNLNKQT